MVKTTVVISNYNYGRFLSSSIQSCLEQNVPCQIIIVDDCSSDHSWKVITNAIKNNNCSDKYICGIRLNNNSKGNARGKNVGISLSKTPYITCLDSDDMLMPNSLFVREEVLDANEDIDWVHGKAHTIDSSMSYRILLDIARGLDSTRKDFYDRVIHLPEEDTRWYLGVEASTVMCRRYVYDKFGLYDENLRWKIDREMWYRFLCHGCKKKFIDVPVSIYRKHPREVTRNKKIKNPDIINAMFDIIIKERIILDKNNTIFISNYNSYKYISSIEGVIFENII